MGKMTEENLAAAFAGESQAHVKYLVFADRAEKEGRTNIARLFRAASFSEQVHATNHLRALGQVGATADNLAAAIAGETFEVEEMYPAYLEVARLEGNDQAQRSMRSALEAEKVHARLYQEVKKSADAGADASLGTVQVCGVCGYTLEGEAPDKCPVCGAKKEMFRAF